MSSNLNGVQASLEEVMITSQLDFRPARQVNYQRQNEAFRELADLLATDPEKTLARLVKIAMELCDADTVGISVEETNEGGEKVFRWVQMAGDLEHLVGGSTPRFFSPCGVCVDTNRPLLMDRLFRAYPYFRGAPLPFIEALLLPWGTSGGPVGTLWIVAHSDRRKFDRDDLQIVGCLAAFAYGAIQLKTTLLESQRAVAAARIASEMAHHINNPLQGAMLALFQANTCDVLSEARQWISTADAQLQRVRELSAELLLKDLLKAA